MVTLLRRFLVLAALFFWLGGFTFYAAVVVPIGQAVLLSGTTQGFVTRRVAVYLNLAGAVALVPLLWDALGPAASVGSARKLLRLGCWVGLAVTLVFLVWMHPRVDAFLDAEAHVIEDFRAFRSWHRWYLWTSTVQWALGVAYMALMVCDWRSQDRHGVRHKLVVTECTPPFPPDSSHFR